MTVENVSGKGQGMAVAIIGLPAGLTLPEDLKQLKDLRPADATTAPSPARSASSRLAAASWSSTGATWPRTQKIELTIDLICRVPGEYRGPASRAYLYYNADTSTGSTRCRWRSRHGDLR